MSSRTPGGDTSLDEMAARLQAVHDRAVTDAVGEGHDAARQSMVERIEERMRVLNLNPFSAAKKAGLGDDYVRDIIRGKVKNPSAERLGKLAIALECSLYYLIGQSEREPRLHISTPDGPEPAPPPPAPLPVWADTLGKPVPQILPIKFELMASTYRRVTDVVRAPIGFEAAIIPTEYAGREAWWELVRDDSMSRVAPEGSLVLVVAMDDSERHLVAEGEFVIVHRRLLGPSGTFYLQERSMRRVVYRYPDLGLWFLEYAHSEASDYPGLDLSDDIWLETEPTADRKPWKSRAQEAREFIESAENDEERAMGERLLARLEEEETAQLRQRAQNPAIAEALARLEDPDHWEEFKAKLSSYEDMRPRFVGKVVQVLTRLDKRPGRTP